MQLLRILRTLGLLFRIPWLCSLLVGAGVVAQAGTIPQTIEWNPGAFGYYLRLGKTTALRATASSGLPVSFRVEYGPARIVEGGVYVDGLGAIGLVLEQPGDALYAAAPVVRRAFNAGTARITNLSPPLPMGKTGYFEVGNGLACFDGGAGNLVVADIRNPEAPRVAGRIPVCAATNLFHFCLDAKRRLAYVTLTFQEDGTNPPKSGTLKVVDLSDPAAPRVVASLLLTGTLAQCRLMDSYLVVGGFSEDPARYLIGVVDISDPTHPRQVTSQFWAGDPFDFRVEDRVAIHYELWDGHVSLTDLLDPLHPVEYWTPCGKRTGATFAAKGRLAYLVDFTDGIHCIDFSNPAKPVEKALLRSPHISGTLWVQGNLLIAYRSDGMTIWDVSDPLAPVYIGNPSWADGREYPTYYVQMDGDVLWTAQAVQGTLGLSPYRIRRGLNTSILFALPPSVSVGAGPILLDASSTAGVPIRYRLVSGPGRVDGNLLTILGEGSITVAAETESEQFLPTSVERTILVAEAPRITVPPRAVVGNATGSATLSVEAVGAPPLSYQWYDNGVAVGDQSSSITFTGLSAGTNHLVSVMVKNDAGVALSEVVPVTAEPGYSGFRASPRGVYTRSERVYPENDPVCIRQRGNLAFLGNGSDLQVRILDVSNPDAIGQVGKIEFTQEGGWGYPYGIAFVDDYALVSARSRGLEVFDLANPSAPKSVALIALPGSYASSIVVRDRIAYVGNEEAGLLIFDVDDPAHPVQIGRWTGLGQANGVALDGNRAYVAHWYRGVEIVDVTHPSAPIGLGVVTNAPQAYGINYFDFLPMGDVLAVLDVGGTAQLLDVTDPRNPSRIGGTGAFPPRAWHSQKVGNYAFTAGVYSWSPAVTDISNPRKPRSAFWIPRSDYTLGLHIHGNRALMAGKGLAIWDLTFPPMAPVITDPPESRRLVSGGTLTLEVAAAGTEPFTYQWRHNGDRVPGATGPQLQVASAGPSDSGDYTVEVTNNLGSVVSNVAHVRVADLQVIPESLFRLEDQSVTFELATAPGSSLSILRSSDLVTWTEVQRIRASDRLTLVKVAPTTNSAGGGEFYRVETQ